MKASSVPFDIAAVGLGIAGIHQISREVDETIRRCRKTFVTDMGIGVLDYLKTVSPDLVDLSNLYELGTHRILIYRRMATEVIAAALDDPPVCFATYGHPKMYSYPTTLIQRAARVLDLRVWVLPGISSLDTMLVDLNIDPAMDGLQVYEATDLVIRRRPIQVDVPCVILQPSIVLDAFNRPGRPQRENVARLRDYLLEYYPPEHRATLFVSKTHPLLEPLRIDAAINELEAAIARASNVATLFIPPIRPRAVADQALADAMKIPATAVANGPLPQRRPGRPAIGPKADS